MWICLDCRETFEEPKRYVETHNLDTPPYEIFYVCPYCNGNYVEAHMCDMCGYYINGEYIKLVSGERICEDCYTKYELGDED